MEEVFELMRKAKARIGEMGLDVEVFGYALMFLAGWKGEGHLVTPEILGKVEQALACGLMDWDV